MAGHAGVGAEGAAEWKRSWTVVLAATTGLYVNVSSIYSLGIFIEPLQREFGWSRGGISAGATVVSVFAVLFAPIVGALIDRIGPRRIGLLGLLIYCSATAALGAVGEKIWMWWSCWSLLALGSLCIKPTVWTAGLVGHFKASRGLALSIALCGTGLAQASVPLITQTLVDALGWRASYAMLGAMLAVISLPAVYLFFFDVRDQRRRKSGPDVAQADAPGVSARAGLTSYPFIALALSALLATAAVAALVVHFVPMLTASGISRGSAAWAAGLVGVLSITGRICCGVLLDRFDGRLVGCVSFALPIVACLMLMNLPASVPYAVMVSIVLGLSVGAEFDVIAYLSARYFGLKNFGLLFGVIVGMVGLGSGTGILFAGMMYDHFGSYHMAQMVLIPVLAVSAGLIASLRSYPRFNT